MKVIIVAAGLGSRLGNITKETPKGLVNINGKSILERQIFLFKKYGVSDITVIIGPYSEKYSFRNVSYIQDTKYIEHDLLSSLMLARSIMIDDVIISYGDIIFDDVIIKSIINFKGDVGLAVDMNWEKKYRGQPKNIIDKISNVLITNDFVAKIGYNMQFRNYGGGLGEFIGLMKLSKKSSNLLVRKYLELEKSHIGTFHDSNSLKDGILTDMLQELIDSNVNVTPVKIDGKWCEIDTPQDLKRAREMFKSDY